MAVKPSWYPKPDIERGGYAFSPLTEAQEERLKDVTATALGDPSSAVGRAVLNATPEVMLTAYAPTSGDDWTDAFTEAIADAVALGGATIVLPGGDLGISGEISIPSGVNLRGSSGNTLGSNRTRILALTADARLRFGVWGVGNWGGVSSGFLLDGNTLSPTMLVFGRALERTFIGIGVVNCAAGSYAVIFEEAQNNLFLGMVVNSNYGGGISFDRGAGHNKFSKLNVRGNGITDGYHLRFIATAATVSGLLAYPIGNTFSGCVIEDDGGNLAGAIYHGAGGDNVFLDCNLAAGAAATRAYPLVKIEVANAGISNISTQLAFIACEFTGTQAQTTLFDMNNAAIVHVVVPLKVQGFLHAFRLRDTSSQPWVDRRIVYSAVTNRLDPASVGTLNSAVRSRFGNPLEVTLSSATDTALIVSVEGEAGMRREIRPDGDRFMDGSSFTPNVVTGWQAADMWGTSLGDSIRAGGAIWGRALAAKTASYTAVTGDQYLLCDATAGAVTISLPSAATVLAGKTYTVKKTDASANGVVIDPNGAQTIDGAATKTITTQYGSIGIVSDGSNWHIVSQNGTIA